jgi:hypothetical protein
VLTGVLDAHDAGCVPGSAGVVARMGTGQWLAAYCGRAPGRRGAGVARVRGLVACHLGGSMSTTTLIIIIVVLVLLFGGGGFWWRGR